jgi:hypothetical protein
MSSLDRLAGRYGVDVTTPTTVKQVYSVSPVPSSGGLSLVMVPSPSVISTPKTVSQNLPSSKPLTTTSKAVSPSTIITSKPRSINTSPSIKVTKPSYPSVSKLKPISPIASLPTEKQPSLLTIPIPSPKTSDSPSPSPSPTPIPSPIPYSVPTSDEYSDMSPPNFPGFKMKEAPQNNLDPFKLDAISSKKRQYPIFTPYEVVKGRKWTSPKRKRRREE